MIAIDQSAVMHLDRIAAFSERNRASRVKVEIPGSSQITALVIRNDALTYYRQLISMHHFPCFPQIYF